MHTPNKFYKESVFSMYILAKLSDFSVFFEPFGDFLQSSNSMFWFTGPGKFVIFSLENYHFAFHSMSHKAGVELVSLINWTTIIFIGMDDKGWCLALIQILHWAVAPEFFRILPWIGLVLVIGKADSDVGNAKEGEPV